jgi:hypothetical protein
VRVAIHRPLRIALIALADDQVPRLTLTIEVAVRL